MRAKSLLVFLSATTLAATLAAQTKISGTAQCKPDPATPVAIDDKPNHAFAVGRAQCTWTKPIEMAGVQVKDGVSTSLDEMTGDAASGRGYHVGTMANGDKFFSSFQGTAKSKDGVVQSAHGTFTFSGGTGKLKGLKGKGTYTGKANPDKSMTYEIKGEYQLP
jgi:hypothetical protein